MPSTDTTPAAPFIFQADRTPAEWRDGWRYDFWAPPIKAENARRAAIVAFNRAAIATGCARVAEKGAHADYNGHTVFVEWNDYTRSYIAHYTWAGIHRIGRGTFQTALDAALRYYRQGRLGSEIRVILRAGDLEALEVCRTTEALRPYTPTSVDEYEADLPWQARSIPSGGTRTGIAFIAADMEKRQAIPATLFFDAPDRASWDLAVRAYLRERRGF